MTFLINCPFLFLARTVVPVIRARSLSIEVEYVDPVLGKMVQFNYEGFRR